MIYDRSYEGFGRIRVTLLRRGEMVRCRTHGFRDLWLTVSGQRDDGRRVTQSDLLYMNEHPLTTFWMAQPFTNRTLRLVFDSEPGLKFKLRFLSSC